MGVMELVTDTDGEKLRESVAEEKGEEVRVKGWEVAIGERVTVLQRVEVIEGQLEEVGVWG